MANASEIALSVILYQEDGHWVAQGLEFDITAQGKSPPDAAKKFGCKVGAELIMSIELGDETPLCGVGPAPDQFWAMFRESDMTATVEQVPLRITNAPASPRIQPRMKIGERLVA